MNRTAIVLLGLGVMGSTVSAQAETHTHTHTRTRNDHSSVPPGGAGVSRTALPSYTSAFDGYRPFREEATNRWRELNDTVGQVGGHVGVLKGGAAGVAPSATQPSTTPSQSTSSATEHRRHGKH